MSRLLSRAVYPAPSKHGKLATIVICCLLIVGTACSSKGSEAEGEGLSAEAKSTVLFIGDGLGASHREAIRLSTAGEYGELEMDRLPYYGMSRTVPDDPESLVTDSAAGGSAISTGLKTRYGVVGLDAEGEPALTLLERAQESGKATGIVTTAEVTDSPTASFAAHVPDRGEQPEIARQYVEETRPDVILGGGEDFWYPKGDPGAYPNDAEDTESLGVGDLPDRMEEQGYSYIADPEELEGAEGRQILGLFANRDMFEAGGEESGSYEPVVTLTEMTRKAIDTLSKNKDGFFLVVEEAAIDDMSHEKNAELTLEAGRQLDEAVGVAKSYRQKNPDTLLVVTADHETGGLAVRGEPGDKEDDTVDGPFPVAGTGKDFWVDWSTDGHTPVAVPVTAAGPGAKRLTGNFENTHIHDAIEQAMFGEDDQRKRE